MNEPDVTEQPKAPTPVACSALLGVEACGLHRKTPYGMTSVRMTQFSIARFYGGIKYNGDSYTYLPHTEELIRDDVLKWQKKQKRAAKTPNSVIKRLDYSSVTYPHSGHCKPSQQ